MKVKNIELIILGLKSLKMQKSINFCVNVSAIFFSIKFPAPYIIRSSSYVRFIMSCTFSNNKKQSRKIATWWP